MFREELEEGVVCEGLSEEVGKVWRRGDTGGFRRKGFEETDT